MDIVINGTIIPSGDQWVYDWFGLEAVSPQKVRQGLAEANGQEVEVYINSGGGDVFAGTEIYDLLRTYAGKVMIHVQSIAASAASVILCARESDISPAGMIMIHNVSVATSGDHREMKHAMEVLRKVDRSIAAAYAEKTGMKEDEILDLMGSETYMTAQDAVKRGFVDRIRTAGRDSPKIQLAASAGGGLLPKAVLDKAREMKNREDARIVKAKLDLLKWRNER